MARRAAARRADAGGAAGAPDVPGELLRAPADRLARLARRPRARLAAAATPRRPPGSSAGVVDAGEPRRDGLRRAQGADPAQALVARAGVAVACARRRREGERIARGDERSGI